MKMGSGTFQDGTPYVCGLVPEWENKLRAESVKDAPTATAAFDNYNTLLAEYCKTRNADEAIENYRRKKGERCG